MVVHQVEVQQVDLVGTDNNMQNQQTDQQALALTHAIALAESGPNGKPDYNAVGDNGTSKGAYQWQPGNFEAAATTAGLDPTDFSPENQDKVAYSQVKAYKDKGYDPGQIASLWNSGSPNNWQNHSGTITINGKTISYDTPTYVKKVQSHYQQITGGQQGYNPKPYSSPGNEFQLNTTGQSDNQTNNDTGLMSQLGNRAQDISSNIADISKQLQGQPGSQGWWSDLLQTGGDVAGGINDVIGAGLKLIPGVSQAENWLGGEVGKVADTQVGQSVVKSIQSFQQSNPELSKDIGAGFNIATVIPIFKGLSVVKDLAASGLGTALKSVGEDAIDSDLSKMAIASGKKGMQFLQDNPGIYKQVAQEGLPLDMIEGKLSTQGAVDESWDRITDLNNQVKPILDQPQYANVGSDGQSIAQKALSGYVDRNGIQVSGLPESGMLPQDLIDNAKSLDPHNKLLWEKFEAGQANLKEINQLRSSLDSKVKAVFTDVPTVSASKEEGALLSGAMRDTVQTSAPETQPMFQNMSKMFKLQQALKYVEGKRIKTSLMRGAIQRIAGGLGGAGVARMMGGGIIPEAISAYAGEKAAGMLGRKTVGGILGSLVK
jgi:hypothetical protein